MPQRIEGALAHFTLSSFSFIEAPESWFSLPELERQVQELFAKAKGEDLTPTVGDYCRFCEARRTCPTQQNSMDVGIG